MFNTFFNNKILYKHINNTSSGIHCWRVLIIAEECTMFIHTPLLDNKSIMIMYWRLTYIYDVFFSNTRML